jgi:SAM-dependent methyltransferase
MWVNVLTAAGTSTLSSSGSGRTSGEYCRGVTGASSPSYIIHGGEAGRDRLRVIGRVMWPTTEALLRRVGIPPDAACLDVGCGGGDVSVKLRQLVPLGSVVGVDLDPVKIGIAESDSAAAGLTDIEFRVEDVTEPPPSTDVGRFEVVYVRFVLTHLTDPAAAVAHLLARVAPGGTLIVEDIDCSGHVCFPASAAHDRYVRWYSETATRRGVDPNIGPRLPFLLRDAGVQGVSMHIVQPSGFEGEVKSLVPESVVQAGLATEQEVAATVAELETFAERDDTILGVPRIVQAWGRRSGTSRTA